MFGLFSEIKVQKNLQSLLPPPKKKLIIKNHVGTCNICLWYVSLTSFPVCIQHAAAEEKKGEEGFVSSL